MRKTTGAVLGVGLAMGSGAATAHAADFDWLAGQWCGGTAERKIEEVWLPQAGGMLLGMSRTVHGRDVESFEFMRLVPEGADAGLHVQPNGVPPTTFRIESQGDGWVVFSNPAHDFPNRIEYRRDGQALRASISGPGEGGKPVVIPFDYQRCTTR